MRYHNPKLTCTLDLFWKSRLHIELGRYKIGGRGGAEYWVWVRQVGQADTAQNLPLVLSARGGGGGWRKVSARICSSPKEHCSLATRRSIEAICPDGDCASRRLVKQYRFNWRYETTCEYVEIRSSQALVSYS